MFLAATDSKKKCHV
ncbi:hypothetical protein V2J09_016451 [Rumex salicifolius]